MSDIQAYFENKTVFVTGSSGFLGKLLVEKLLRSCFNLNKIYLLLREKKGVKPTDRLNLIFNSKAFDLLKNQNPNYTKKISILNGDLERPNLGLSKRDEEIFKENVQIVFHCGATVRFDETLKKVASVNIKATKDLIELCRSTKKLESFVYVSTAYSNCNLNAVKERIYEPYLKPDNFFMITNGLDDDTLGKITPIILKDLPNTYVLSKAAAENLLYDEGVGLPISILRPSIVISSVNEPMPGWTDNWYAVTGAFGAAGLGVLHFQKGDKSKKADLIPVDYVVNNLIAVAYDTYKRKKELQLNGIERNETLKIFTSTLGTRNPIIWGDFAEKVCENKSKYPVSSAMWYPFGGMIKSRLFYGLNTIFLHYLPALIVDFALIQMLKEPFMFKLAKKLDKFIEAISYFTLNEWTFDDSNNKELYSSLSEVDRKIFPFDMETLNWDDYTDNFVKGLRVYLLNDPIETLPGAKRKYKVLAFIHYTTVLFLLYLTIRFLMLVYFKLF